MHIEIVMINRTLIRIKVVQIVYAFYQNQDRSLENGEKELLFSLSKSYDLYNQMLYFMVKITEYSRRRIDTGRNKMLPTVEELAPNEKFANNRFIQQLEVNTQLLKYLEISKKDWATEENYVKELYDSILASDIYKEYMASEEDSWQADREFWRKIYKQIIQPSESLDQMLEEQSLYWNDDKEIVDSFVLKTIRRFEEANGAKQEILPEYKDEEDMEYASRLFRRTIENQEYYYELIRAACRNWDFSRIAFMDLIIMQIVLAEILSFPNIPISVSINEYLEVAKLYSTQKSASFINGTLDGIVKQLKKEGKLLKK